MILSSRKFVGFVLGALAVTAITVACGSDDESKFKDPNAEQPSFLGPDGGFYGGEAGDDPLGKLLQDDPPAAWCGLDGGAPPAVGGTEKCPTDKNLPGCPCVGDDGNGLSPGATKACWTGQRKNRGLGQCKDGVTTCVSEGENKNVWGPCLGQKLPTPNATGDSACSCFSIGLWKIDNTAPCIWSQDGSTYYAYSPQPPADGSFAVRQCDGTIKPGQTIKEKWSKDRLTTDCAGTFTLCFRIRVGDPKNPSPNDCILGESCTLADYQESGKEQELPELDPWFTPDTPEGHACAKKWEIDTPEDKLPGYGEMIVRGGQTVRCEAVSDVPNDKEFVFNRVEYCPRICRPGYKNYKPNDPLCQECQLSGKGKF